MRITGLATGMDIDSMVKEGMRPYRIKVDKAQQENDIYAMKQQLYRDVLKDSQDFYNKNFDVLKKDSLISSSSWETVKFSSSNENAVTMKGTAGSTAGNYTVNVKEVATSASTTLKDTELIGKDKIEMKVKVDGTDKIISINTNKSDGSGKKSASELVDELNKELKSNGSDITAKYSEFSKGISLETAALGKNITFDVSLKDDLNPSNNIVKNATGIDAEVVITNSKNETYTHTGSSNFLKLDGVEFTFNSKTEAANPVKISGKSDVAGLKDKIVAFVNDYNKLLEGINTKIYEKRDKKYMPLTPEQKKEMSADEIKMWEAKTKEGQLRKDGDLERLSNSMKNVLSPMMAKLEKIGIKPVSNYNEKNGMLVIDENKLTQALENNASEVKDIFIKAPTDDKTNDGGIMHSLKKVLYDQTVTVTSPLIKKVGMEGSVTATTNDYTKIMDKKKLQIAEMQSQLTQRENNLYQKYARLETQMAKLNNQNASLAKQFGA